MFARRAAPEVLSSDQNAGALVSRLVEDESFLSLACSRMAPIVKEKLAKPRTLDPLQKLLRDDLVRVHIDAVERRHSAPVHAERLHRRFSIVIFRVNGISSCVCR